MTIRISIIDGPIPAERQQPLDPGAGAILTFEGIVRPLEDGKPLAALDYDVYDPMATRQLHAIAHALASELALLAIDLRHSRGRVPVGQCSLRITIAARHRAESLTAMSRLIDLLKKDVPIWKKPVWAADPAPQQPGELPC